MWEDGGALSRTTYVAIVRRVQRFGLGNFEGEEERVFKLQRIGFWEVRRKRQKGRAYISRPEKVVESRVGLG